jgi:hypothetical protein
VQIAQRWIVARMRNEVFHSPAAMNARIRELLVDLNARKMRRYGKSRRELFEQFERADIDHAPFYIETAAHLMIDFRSLRDSGITWRFLAGHRESAVQREAGHRKSRTSARPCGTPRKCRTRTGATARRSLRCLTI